MPELDLIIVNEKGMHARAAGEFTKVASRFRARVSVSHDGTEVDGKSLLGVLMLAAYCGTTIRVRAEGADADLALAALKELVENKFGEDA